LATLADVAKRAGVSKATVSRILNGRPLDIAVREETRLRVERAAAELGYRPSLFAQGLRTKRTRLVGVIVRDLTNPFWAGLLEGITATCAARGYHVTLSHTRTESEQVNEASLLADLGSDGMLVVGDHSSDEAALAQLLTEARAAVVVARSGASLGVPSVRVDNAGAVQMAVDYLVALGHRRIAFLGGGSDDARERHRAFVAVCLDRGVPVQSEHVYVLDRHGPLSIVAAVRLGQFMARRLVALPEPPTAVLTTSDGLAFGAVAGALSRGYSIPDDISIVGFDGLPFARFASPPLTMVHQPVHDMGAVAANLLVDIIEDKVPRRSGTEIRLPAKLVVRSSCGPPRPQVAIPRPA